MYSTANHSWLIFFTGQGQPLPSGNSVRWCELTATNCVNTARAAIHEFGHILSLSHTSTADVRDEGESVMWESLPKAGAPGGGTDRYKTCDQAKLQMVWDVASFATSAYSDCLDHIADAAPGVGLETTTTFRSTATTVCVGLSATFSGTLTVNDEPGYERLGGNQLRSRDIRILRRPTGSGGFVNYDLLSTSSVSASWSRTYTFHASTDYEWRAKFEGEDGLALDFSPYERVRWIAAC